jgi:hypothetical protein
VDKFFNRKVFSVNPLNLYRNPYDKIVILFGYLRVKAKFDYELYRLLCV